MPPVIIELYFYPPQMSTISRRPQGMLVFIGQLRVTHMYPAGPEMKKNTFAQLSYVKIRFITSIIQKSLSWVKISESYFVLENNSFSF